MQIKIILIVFCLLIASLVRAQNLAYPNKVIKIFVPATAAGPTDFIGRLVADFLTKSLNQSVVVDNLPGAGGNQAFQALLRADPDGHTMAIGSQSMMAMGPYLYKHTPFDHEKDFIPVDIIAAPAYILVVNNGVSANNLQELITLAKSKPGLLNYASTNGIGSSSHVVGELLKRTAQIDIVHVPYKGNAQATTDLLGGNVQMMFSLSSSMTQPINSGALKAIAIGSLKRSPTLPKVPTFEESGLTGFTASSWFGVFVRAGTSNLITQKINSSLEQMLQDPNIRKKLLSAGADPAGGSVEQAADFLRNERQKWGNVIKSAQISLD
ncbi:MAG: tripartite tricarboxylate transporter substrate binding protein [Betaproteobacteria bacterium]